MQARFAHDSAERSPAKLSADGGFRNTRRPFGGIFLLISVGRAVGGGILEHVRLRFLDIHDLASCAVEREETCRLHRFGAVYLFYVPCDDGIYVAPAFLPRQYTV